MYLAIPPFLPLSSLCPHFSRFPVKARAYSTKTLRYLPAAGSKYSNAARCGEVQRDVPESHLVSLNSRAALEFLITTSRESEIFSGKRGARLPRIASYANPDFTFSEWRQSKLRATCVIKKLHSSIQNDRFIQRAHLCLLFTQSIEYWATGGTRPADRYIPAGIRHSVCA